mgnify:CR=1 FL=1
MNTKNWFLIAAFAIILILMIKFVGLTGYGVFLGFMGSGNSVIYDVKDVGAFVQCWDSDPANLWDVKGYCHSQYYDDALRKLVGRNSVDFCHSEDNVVDYYCSNNLICRMEVRGCGDGYFCSNGKCVKKEVFLFPEFSKLKIS